MRVTVISTLLASLLTPFAKADGEIFSIHGSGTTNPSKCLWHIMSLFEERSRVTTRLTYRAVGSSTGQLEFLGAANGYQPHNHFGAGDIPIPTDDYTSLNENGSGESRVVHLPFALSSVSFFHNIPGVPDSAEGLNLNACLLARIFDGKIRYWNDPDILAENKHLTAQLEAVASGDTPIFVARRVHGSSSTSSITKYLNEACPNEWPLSKVGSELGGDLDDWHVSTHACQGSSVMTSCIRENAGSIGYLDSGHGWSEKLAEVNVQNKDSYFVSSRIAREKNGITSAASMATDLPIGLDEDWGHVNFINKSGEWTWPIVVMSYVYLRKNPSELSLNQEEKGLLKLFLESLYDSEYFGRCEALGFSDVPEKLQTMAKEALEDIEWGFALNEDGESSNMWSHETKKDTRKIAGMGKFVISGKRQSLAGLTIDEIAGLETKEQKKIAELESIISSLTGGKTMIVDESNDNKVQAALVLSAISFTIICCAIVGLVVNRFFVGKSYDLAVPKGDDV